MKDLKNAVLAAIDDNWRQFRNSLDRLHVEDMSVAGVYEGMSTNDIVGHITTWEWELVNSLDRGAIEPVGDVDRFNAQESLRKKDNTPRQTLEQLEDVHRSLRDQLSKAPSAYFEPFDPFRELIDSCTVLHYQEHGTQIRIWASKNSHKPSK
ncbi:MAG: hypothetical protein HOF01_01275 [Chloroflexi bacterium]|jgi:hypothetical protein|nr:hypothetical protein [Chloroflexota bacterium]